MESTHIIFDLDGTLIDSRQEIINTYKKVIAEIEPENEVDFDSINYGATLPSILKAIYGANRDAILKATLKFSEIYDRSLFEETLLYPSVNDVIEKLFHKKNILHIATNKRLTPTISILKQKKMFQYFASVKASDMMPNTMLSKQLMVETICKEFNVKKGYMIGDSSQDIEAGINNNLTTVAALYGYEKKESLLKKNPKFVIHHFSELNKILLP
jgi:phosphoglycolate phosphatase